MKAYCKAIYNKDPFDDNGKKVSDAKVLAHNETIKVEKIKTMFMNYGYYTEYTRNEIYMDVVWYRFHPWEKKVVGFLLLALSIWGIVTYGRGEKAPAKESEGKKQAEAKKKAR